MQRDRHAHYLSTLALIGATMEKIATEIRGLQKSEVREVQEAFRVGQKGSSSMPHKRNPVGSENITGCARLLRGYMITAFENVALWHERDISHSSAERVIIPDATTIVHYALDRLTRIVRNLVVNADMMRENMERTFGLYHSQRLLIALIDKGLNREAAYDMVQPKAMQSWDEHRPFLDIVLESKDIAEHLSETEIRDVFDPAYHIRNVPELLERCGLD